MSQLLPQLFMELSHVSTARIALRLSIIAVLFVVSMIAAPRVIFAWDGQAAEDKSAKSVEGLFLDRAEPRATKKDSQTAHAGLLGRELLRQAVLIVARDDFGLMTRDATLGDEFDPKRCRQIHINTEVFLSGEAALQLSFEIDGKETSRTIPIAFEGRKDIIDYSKFGQAVNRTATKEIPAVLREAGFNTPTKEKPATDVAPIPQQVEAQLDRLSPITQFQAVRSLHQEMSKSGPSITVLTDLSRGYANLAMISHPLWSSHSQAFLARALLYASRAIDLDPKSPAGYWSLGYALVLAGCDDDASSALMEAENLRRAGKITPPKWTELLEYLTQHNHVALEKAISAQERPSELAQFIRWRTRGGDWWLSRSAVIPAREFARDYHPLCVPMTFGMFRSHSINDGHQAMQSFLPALSKEIRTRLADTPGLPKSVIAATNEAKDSLEFIPRTLISDTGEDNGEPSLACLGHLMEDMIVTHSAHTLAFMSKRWGVPWQQYREQIEPLVKSHPLRDYLTLTVGPPTAAMNSPKMAFLNEPVIDFRFPMIDATRHLYGVKQGTEDVGQRFWRQAVKDADFTGLDLIQHIGGLASDKDKVRRAEVLRLISNSRPACYGYILKVDGSFGEMPDKDVYELYGEHPEATYLFAEAFIAKGNQELAMKALKHMSEVDGSPWGYVKLAEVYKQAGDQKKWRETLDSLLEQTDQDISHANARVEIANERMDQGQFDEATPYADAAAEFYSEKGLRCGFQCADGKGDDKKAERYVRALVERYPSTLLEWYFWCQRSGKGDIEAARRAMRRALPQLQAAQAPEAKSLLAAIRSLDGDEEGSLQAWNTCYELRPTTTAAIMIALAYQKKGDNTHRDEWLKKAASAEPPDAELPPRLAELSKLMQSDLKSPDDSAFIKKVEELSQNLPTAPAGIVRYVAGRFLQQSGRIEQAKPLLKETAAWSRTPTIFTALAAKFLREHNAENGGKNQ